jgi:hypothetical protein
MNLYTKQIEDKYIRENFEKIEEAFNALVFTLGDFKFFEFRIEGIQDEYKLYHQLGFNPNDVLVTKAIGSSFEFVYTEFTEEYLTIKTNGDLYLRMFIGNMRGDEVVGANAFANVTDDLGGTGGAGGGTGDFYKKNIVVGSAFLSNRDIVLQGAPITDSEKVYVNGLLIDDSNYTINSNILTINSGLNIKLGYKIDVRFAS